MYVEYHHNDLAADDSSSRKSLAEAFGFSDTDLELNKAGKLSTPQLIRLAGRVFGQFGGLILSAAGLAVLGFLLYMIGPSILTRVRLMMRLAPFLMPAIIGLFFGVIALLMKLIFASGGVFQFILDAIDGKVTSVAGRMTTSKNEEIEDGLSTITKQKTETFSCFVKGECFSLSEGAYDELQHLSGGNYRLYITPRSRQVASIEPAVTETGGRDPFKLEYKNRD